MRNVLLRTLWLGALMALPIEAQGIDDLAGQWRTVRHKAIVEISDCGDGTPCGHLVWVDTAFTEGETRDVRNRSKALRVRPLDGLQVLWGFRLAGARWRSGKLYNPDDGKTFAASLQLLSHDELGVSGCIGPLCRQQVWKRLSPHQDNQNNDIRESANDQN